MIKELHVKIKPGKFCIYRFFLKKTLGWGGFLPLCLKLKILVSLNLLHKNEKGLYDEKKINQI